jgi:hypothetical protein
MSKSSIALLHPFANFKFFNQWNGYISVLVLKDYLAKHGIGVQVFDLSGLLSDYMLGSMYLQKRQQELSQEIGSLEGGNNIRDLTYYLDLSFLVHLLLEFSEKKIHIGTVRSFFREEPPLYQAFVRPLDVSRIQDILPEHFRLHSEILTFEHILKEVMLRIPSSAVYGITVPSKLHFNSAIILSHLLKQKDSDCHICLGGPYVSLVDKSRLANLIEAGTIDTYITRDGENRFLRLLRDLISPAPASVKGEYKKGAHPRVNELSLTSPQPEGQPVKLILSKGCYWGKCAYCDYRNLSNHFSIKRVTVLADEIASYYQKGSTRFLLMTDAIPPMYAKRLAQELIQRDLKIMWGSRFLRVDTHYDRDLFLLLKKSGVDFGLGSLGMDSFSDSALNLVRKGYDRKVIIRFFEAAEGANVIFGKLNLIYDLPGTDYRDALDTVAFLERFINQYRSLAIFKFKLTPTSEMGLYPRRFGLRTELEKTTSTTYNDVFFEGENTLTAEQRRAYLSSLRFIKNTLLIHKNYPYIDKRVLLSHRDYSGNIRLSITKKTEEYDLLLRFNGKGDHCSRSFSFPKGFVPDPLSLEHHELFSKLRPDTWYTVEDIAHQNRGTSSMESVVHLPDTYHIVRHLLAKGFFADVAVEENAPDSR